MNKLLHTSNISLSVPFGSMGEITYLRTYSPYNYANRQRENFEQTTDRWIGYNLGLARNVNCVSSPDEYEKLKLHSMNLGLFPSGRTMYVGGRSPSYEVPQSNFNCSFRVLDELNAFCDIMELSMVGSGVGFSVEHKYISHLPPLKAMNIVSLPYQPRLPHDRLELTEIVYHPNTNSATVSIGDSKAGWVGALRTILTMSQATEAIDTIYVDYNSVRPEGEPLKRFGGRASGPEPLFELFAMIERISREQGTGTYSDDTLALAAAVSQELPPLAEGWTSIQALDLGNMIGHCVVVGGVRRTAEIALGDQDDEFFRKAKSNLYDPETNQSHMSWRYCSNNSVMFYKRPSLDNIRDILDTIKHNGEPGFINAQEAQRRRPNFKGVNPCAEILLDDKGVCNLSTVNLMAYVVDSEHDGEKTLNYELLEEAFRLATRIGVRQTCVELTLPGWNETQKRDRLIGVSMTGWMDMLEALGAWEDKMWQQELLLMLREIVQNEAFLYAEELGIDEPLLATTVKPEGTLSKLPTVSSGLTPSIAPYYVRRMRIDAKDPVAIVARESGIPTFPLYKRGDETLDTATTWVLEFPVKSSAKRTTYDYGAIELLEQYKMFMQNYVDHNASNTIYVRDEEWDEVAQWLYNNWDCFVGISFMRYFDARNAPFPQMPEEIISEAEYEQRMATMPTHFDYDRLRELDRITNYDDIQLIEEACASGVCPIR